MDVTTIGGAAGRLHPANVLALSGLALLTQGLWFGFTGSEELLRESGALGWMRLFRLAVVGRRFTGIGVAPAGQALAVRRLCGNPG